MPKRHKDIVSAIKNNLNKAKGCLMTLINFGLDYRTRPSSQNVCIEMTLCAKSLNLLLDLVGGGVDSMFLSVFLSWSVYITVPLLPFTFGAYHVHIVCQGVFETAECFVRSCTNYLRLRECH